MQNAAVTAKVLWIFYRKLCIPAAGFSLLAPYMFGQFHISAFGNAFLILLPVFHYLIYEGRFPGEYVFYANFGLSKKSLWIITVSISLGTKILTSVV